MKVVMRVDAGHEVGVGHLTRCHTLACELQRRDAVVRYAACPTDEFTRIVARRPDLALPGPVSFQALSTAEAIALAPLLRDADWIVVDHYGADSAYLDALRAHAPHAALLLFDDHQSRAGADLRLAPMQASEPHTLGGLEHLMLRPAFRDFAAPDRTRRAGLTIAIGGTDPTRQAANLIERLLDGCWPRPPLTVLSADNDIDRLLCRWPTTARRIRWLAAEGLAEQLRGSESAIVSASGLAFEALAMGCPIVALQWSSNQAAHAACLARYDVPVAFDVSTAAQRLMQQGARWSRPFDAHGARRVADALEQRVQHLAEVAG